MIPYSVQQEYHSLTGIHLLNFDYLLYCFSLKLQIWHLLRARSSLTFRQTIGCRLFLKLVYDIITYSYSHKKLDSLEIWAVKIRFLLIYENMLKCIGTARRECTAKQENKTSYNTDYIVPDLIDFFGDGWKEIKTRLKKEIFVIVKKIELTKYWFTVSDFSDFPKAHMQKCSGHLYFLLKSKVKFTTFRTF